MANDSILGVNENGDWKELSSIDEEDTDSGNHNDEDVDGVSADSSIEDRAEEDAYEEQFNEPEDDTAV
jgi:cleavage and polyadenylation specificity factor subunit 4